MRAPGSISCSDGSTTRRTLATSVRAHQARERFADRRADAGQDEVLHASARLSTSTTASTSSSPPRPTAARRGSDTSCSSRATMASRPRSPPRAARVCCPASRIRRAPSRQFCKDAGEAGRLRQHRLLRKVVARYRAARAASGRTRPDRPLPPLAMNRSRRPNGQTRLPAPSRLDGERHRPVAELRRARCRSTRRRGGAPRSR